MSHDSTDEEDQMALITNYKLVIPKDKFSDKSNFSFHSNYNNFNNIKGTCLEIDEIKIDLTSTPDEW